MRMTIFTLVDQSNQISFAQEVRFDRKALLTSKSHRAGHRTAWEIDRPVRCREALCPALLDRRAWAGKPDRHHRPSRRADRTARANWREDCRSTAGSPGWGA